jgi:4-oxalocrotonate tautomerase
MPIVEITLIEGRSLEAKHRLMRKVADAIVEAIDVKPEIVRIILREIPNDHFSVAGSVKPKPAAAKE